MTTQLERLNQDVIELQEYKRKLEKRGRKDLVSKISHKISFLQSHIAEKQVAMQ